MQHPWAHVSVLERRKSEASVLRDLGQDRIVGITQGWKLTGAIKTAERKLADGTLCHGDQRLMSWCVSNAKVEPKGNAIAITKQASGSAKIDPLMAMFNAVALMAGNPQPAPSYQMIIL